MIITKHIVKALRLFLEKHGKSASGFSVEQGWAKATVPRWLSGHTKNMRPAHWAVLKPLLTPYLNKWEGNPFGGGTVTDTERYEVLGGIQVVAEDDRDYSDCPEAARVLKALCKKWDQLSQEERERKRQRRTGTWAKVAGTAMRKDNGTDGRGHKWPAVSYGEKKCPD